MTAGVSRGLVAMVAASTLAAASSSCGRREVAAPSPRQPRHLVLVTIDTLRADRVGAYGWTAARTPAMDRLASRGVRFSRAFANAPITLTSHASLLTGLYPPGHGARHNGMRLSPGVETLATRLVRQGWATGAFVAAFPLDRRFGLDRGFEVYGDRLPRGPDGRPLNERAGAAVVDDALAWLARAGDRRVFVWVHLFEPHAPYEPDPARGPAGAALDAATRYDDEVARADREVGRLIDGLGSRAEDSLLVLAGDHGEAFGEHGEVAHSLFVYDTTLRVPLIVAGPGVPADGRVIDEPVSLADVAPTILDLTGATGMADADGMTLVPALSKRTLPRRALYAESFAPLLDFGWSSLRSLREGGLKVIVAPDRELYDLERDPGELANLAAPRRAEAEALAARAERIAGAELPALADAPGLAGEARARLNALGYLAGDRGAASGRARPDPKTHRALAARMAEVASGELTGTRLREALEAIVGEDPTNGQARMRLGFALLEAGASPRAEREFRAAIAARVPSADPYLGLAGCLAGRGRLAEAMTLLAEASRVEPGNPVVEANIGSLLLDAGSVEAAIERLRSALTADPDLHQARFTLARALARAGRRAEALAEAEGLLRRIPAAAVQRPEIERLIAALRE